jgi:hypothetical protein
MARREFSTCELLGRVGVAQGRAEFGGEGSWVGGESRGGTEDLA